MRCINIDRGWSFGYGSYNSLRAIMGENGEETVDLPHDYMIRSDVSETAAAGPASGYYTAGTAHYTKMLMIPREWEGDEVFLRFDGVMMNASVEING